MGVGMLEDEGLQHAFSDSGFHVDAGEEVADKVEVLFIGRNNQGVIEAVGLDLHPVGRGGGLAWQTAGLHAGGKNAFEGYSHLGGVIVLEGQNR